jgi:hypothetical protein
MWYKIGLTTNSTNRHEQKKHGVTIKALEAKIRMVFSEIKPIFRNNPENQSTIHPVRVVSGFSFV